MRFSPTDFLARYFRYPIAVVLSFVVSGVFFLAIPVINALFFDKGVKTEKPLEVLTEVEVLVNEKKPEVKQKIIRTVVNPNPFRISSHPGLSRSQNFQMDLSLARGNAGDGAVVDAGSMENVVYEAGEVDEQAQVLREIQPKFPEKAYCRNTVNTYIFHHFYVEQKCCYRYCQITYKFCHTVITTFNNSK